MTFIKRTFITRALIASLFLLFSSSALSQNRPLLELMVERLMNQQMPEVLLTANNVQLNGGNMNVVITKVGAARLQENTRDIFLTLPIQANLKGGMTQNVGPVAINMNCEVTFRSTAQVTLKPTLKNNKLVSTSDVVIPVPPVNADCEGMSLPVASALQVLINQNTQHLESEVNKMVEKYLN